MKRMIAAVTVLLAAAMLFGCSFPVPGAKGEAETTQGNSPEEFVLGEAAYEMVTEDVSFKDDAGQTLISMTYTYPVFAETVPAAQKLNEEMQARVAEFVAEREQIAENLEHPMLATDGPFFYDITTTVTSNSCNLISLRFSADWFMGGVHNADTESVVYHIAKGEKQTLKDIFPEAEETVRSTILEYFRNNGGQDMIADAETALAAYAYEEIPFYMENGEAIVHFGLFEFCNGAFGEPVIRTGIVIGG